ncbi:hypothetical protein [Homoserinibacter gongjuensis]|nr:hypothetical protein [Homoserinibacter gongjuensis]
MSTAGQVSSVGMATIVATRRGAASDRDARQARVVDSPWAISAIMDE